MHSIEATVQKYAVGRWVGVKAVPRRAPPELAWFRQASAVETGWATPYFDRSPFAKYQCFGGNGVFASAAAESGAKKRYQNLLSFTKMGD
jgi:hypothetical protein